MAVAVGRWALGVMMFFAGLGKIMGGVGGFVNGFLVPAFAKTFLPAGLVSAYGYALPYAELLIGFLLITGIARNGALLLNGILLISLAFGQLLLQAHATVANIFLYIILTVIVLYAGKYDTWVIGCCNRGAGDAEEKCCG
jgi:thiosulfate dehydrogenase [quinone] large subunit